MCNHSCEIITTMMQQQTGSPAETRKELLVTPDDGYVVGVDIGGTNLRLALADMRGMVLARCSSSIADSCSADRVLDLIRDGVENFYSEPLSRAVPCEQSQRATDVDAGVVIVTSYLMG